MEAIASATTMLFTMKHTLHVLQEPVLYCDYLPLRAIQAELEGEYPKVSLRCRFHGVSFPTHTCQVLYSGLWQQIIIVTMLFFMAKHQTAVSTDMTAMNHPMDDDNQFS